jgi:hypothetical protein
MSEVLRERLNTLYAAVKLGQIDFVLNSIDDDVEYISYAPVKVFPFLGHHRGTAAMSLALRGAHVAFDVVKLRTGVDGDRGRSGRGDYLYPRGQPGDGSLGPGNAGPFHPVSRRQAD